MFFIHPISVQIGDKILIKKGSRSNEDFFCLRVTLAYWLGLPSDLAYNKFNNINSNT